jgi:hypothetical protein
MYIFIFIKKNQVKLLSEKLIDIEKETEKCLEKENILFEKKLREREVELESQIKKTNDILNQKEGLRLKQKHEWSEVRYISGLNNLIYP